MNRRKAILKDKYYFMAKEEGYRARSAYKLIQIDKKYDFLKYSKVLIDLCAAPGGWLQVASKFMPADATILGFDLLPIRPIPNVHTFVGDITSQDCKTILHKHMKSNKADIVLCDGAPNVGADSSKDAFVQNQIALNALKIASETLKRGGAFITKVYRSRDYNALVWALQQLFDSVQAFKPAASRMQSVETFLICQGYVSPDSVDPRLFDPMHVFAEVEGADSGGGRGPDMLSRLSVFHKKFDEYCKRHRQGYDESLGVGLRKDSSVVEFILNHDPVAILTSCSRLIFSLPVGDNDDEIDDNDSDLFYQVLDLIRQNESTTADVKNNCQDLRLLGKGELKNLLKWRLHIRTSLSSIAELGVEDEKKEIEGEEGDDGREAGLGKVGLEVQAMQQVREKEIKKLKKKERERNSKLQKRKDLGMTQHHQAFEAPSDKELFSLHDLGNLDTDEMEEGMGSGDVLDEAYDEEDGVRRDGDENGEEMAQELDDAYDYYITGEGKKKKKPDDKKTRKGSRYRDSMPNEEKVNDAESFELPEGGLKEYVKIMNKKSIDDDDDDNNESTAYLKKVSKFIDNQKRNDGLDKVREDRWFSQDEFQETFLDDVASAVMSKSKNSQSKQKKVSVVDMRMDEDGDLLPEMPLTDKQVRQAKRKKDTERKNRRKRKHEGDLDMDDNDIVIEQGDDDDDDKPRKEETEADDLFGKRDSTLEGRRKELIRQGLGKPQRMKDESSKIEKVAPSDVLPIHDTRMYDSDEEETTDRDRAATLALGFMMLRKSKAKSLVDASYNRYAYNDPEDLPKWFVDDEREHNRPQIPIPKAVLEQMQKKFELLSNKPIRKTLEFQARKRRRVANRVKAVKQKMESMDNSSDVAEREKHRMLRKAMKGTDKERPSRILVVSKKYAGGRVVSAKNRAAGGASGRLKYVDLRMKKDKRGMKKAMQRKGKR